MHILIIFVETDEESRRFHAYGEVLLRTLVSSVLIKIITSCVIRLLLVNKGLIGF